MADKAWFHLSLIGSFLYCLFITLKGSLLVLFDKFAHFLSDQKARKKNDTKVEEEEEEEE